MATAQQIDQCLVQIDKHLNEIFSMSIENLTREENLGSVFSFKEIEDYFVKIIELFKRVKEVNLKEAPYSLLVNYQKQLANAASLFAQARDFNPTAVSNAADIRQQIINGIRDQWDNYLTQSLPLLNIGLLTSNDLSVERSKMNQLISELQDERKAAKEEGEKKLKELNEIIDNAKSFATNAGVSKHSTLFAEESKFHETEAKKWLSYTRNILIAIALTAIIFALLSLLITNNAHLIQFAVTKLVVLTVLFYGLALTNRNYRAHKHNAVMNKHRQNALSTFETFSNASGADNQTKNAVLLETTHAIFSNQQTGYLKSEGETDSNNKIVEIIKNVTTKGE